MGAFPEHIELMSTQDYPKVLICSLVKINRSDTFNNNLLLRNLFVDWPRERLAQIYSSGGNGDEGFCRSDYQLGPCDRVLGSLFYKLKGHAPGEISLIAATDRNPAKSRGIAEKLKSFVNKMFIDTGLYELLFRPRISAEMNLWVKDFQPDIIFAQGYNLTFTWLPLALKKTTGAKLAFLTTDDWPTYLYSGQLGESTFFRWLVRPVVKRATHRLLSGVDVPFAFGQPMAEEYAVRYGKKFLTLNHSDSQARFDHAVPHRVHPPDLITIVATGNYNRFRWPLLLDVNVACQLLQSQGFNARLVVLTSAIESEGAKALSSAQFIDVMPDPGNDLLPSYLKGADILLLAEGFDEGFVSAIVLSVSSKAHLFMYSHRPIIVYAHPDTGIARYAQSSGWAKLITKRSIQELAQAILHLAENKKEAECLVAIADEVVTKFHSHQANREILYKGLSSFKADREENA